MKSFTFFSAKGGVGKSTFTVLLASYLAYFLNKKVLVIDFEAPSYRLKQFRDGDLTEAATEGSALSNYLKSHAINKPYIINCMGKGINQYSSHDIVKLTTEVNNIIAKDEYEYIIFDFPAGLSDATLVSTLSINGLIDLMYIPHSTEMQERREAYRTGVAFSRAGQDVRMLWNKLSPAYIKSPEMLKEAEEQFGEFGLKYSNYRIKSFNKATQTAESRCFVRNTLCWPERYIQMACPEIIPLFGEIKEILDTKE